MGLQSVRHDQATEQQKLLGKMKKVKVKSLSRVRLFATPWTVAYQAPPSMGFSRQECWSGLPFAENCAHATVVRFGEACSELLQKLQQAFYLMGD